MGTGPSFGRRAWMRSPGPDDASPRRSRRLGDDSTRIGPSKLSMVAEAEEDTAGDDGHATVQVRDGEDNTIPKLSVDCNRSEPDDSATTSASLLRRLNLACATDSSPELTTVGSTATAPGFPFSLIGSATGSEPGRSNRKRRAGVDDRDEDDNNDNARPDQTETVPSTPRPRVLIPGRGSTRKARENAVLAIAASARPRRVRAAPTSSGRVNVANPTPEAGPLRVRIGHSSTGSLVMVFSTDPDNFGKTFSKRLKGRSGFEKSATVASTPTTTVTTSTFTTTGPPHYPSIQLNLDALLYEQFVKGDQSKNKPYAGILTPAEADTTKTFPHYDDRKFFEDARLRAEAAWQAKLAEDGVSTTGSTVAETEGSTNRRIPNRGRGRENSTVAAATTATAAAAAAAAATSKIKFIHFGGFEIETWHAAPYPEEYTRNRVLYICEFCLKYMSSDYVAWRHKLKCPDKHPPGDEIYRHGDISFFEVDGRNKPVYCQNLCLLSKLFLGSKTLYYDVEPFLFYTMTVTDQFGCHFVGYFSKEKRAGSTYNVSCILVLPIYQRRGYGHLLIDFSYLLSRVEKKPGSPEKPLSDMGLVSYRGYWRLIMSQQLVANGNSALSVTELSRRTGMTVDDVVAALERLKVLVRDPVTGAYGLCVDYADLKDHIRRHEAKNWPTIEPRALVWAPYVMDLNRPNRDRADEVDDMGGPIAPSIEISGDIDRDSDLEFDVNGSVEGDGDSVGGNVSGDEAEFGSSSPVRPVTGSTGSSPAGSGSSSPSVPRPSLSVSVSGSAPKIVVSHDGTPSHPDWPAIAAIPLDRFELFPPPDVLARLLDGPADRGGNDDDGADDEAGLRSGHSSRPMTGDGSVADSKWAGSNTNKVRAAAGRGARPGKGRNGKVTAAAGDQSGTRPPGKRRGRPPLPEHVRRQRIEERNRRRRRDRAGPKPPAGS